MQIQSSYAETQVLFLQLQQGASGDFEIPEEYNVDAFNYGAVLNNAPNPELAQEYLDFILSPEGQEILRGFGYEPIE